MNVTQRIALTRAAFWATAAMCLVLFLTLGNAGVRNWALLGISSIPVVCFIVACVVLDAMQRREQQAR